MTYWPRCKGQGAIVDFQSHLQRPCSCCGVGMMVDTRSVTLLMPTCWPLQNTSARRVMISGAREMDIEIIATNSDGSPARREYLRGLLGPGAVETVLDPGRAVVEQRLSVNGVLSQQCRDGISRWFSGLCPMDNLLFYAAIEYAEDDNAGVTRPHSRRVLVTFGEQAKDRPDVYEAGESWAGRMRGDSFE